VADQTKFLIEDLVKKGMVCHEMVTVTAVMVVIMVVMMMVNAMVMMAMLVANE
jgi:hypothetical protein